MKTISTIRTYAILQKVTDNTILDHEKNIYNASGKHIIPKWFSKAYDKVILFEVTINEDQTEYYSNAWGNIDADQYFLDKMKRFDSWYDQINEVAKKFSGEIIKLS